MIKLPPQPTLWMIMGPTCQDYVCAPKAAANSKLASITRNRIFGNPASTACALRQRWNFKSSSVNLSSRIFVQKRFLLRCKRAYEQQCATESDVLQLQVRPKAQNLALGHVPLKLDACRPPHYQLEHDFQHKLKVTRRMTCGEHLVLRSMESCIEKIRTLPF